MLSSAIKYSRKLVHIVEAPLGSLQANCYLLHYNKDNILMVDPGENPRSVLKYLKTNEKQIKSLNIFLTHGHWDHTAGVPDILKMYPNAKIYACEKDMPLFTSAKYNLSESMVGQPFTLKDYLKKFVFVKDGQILSLENPSKEDPDKFSIIETPGHSPGGITLKVENKTQKLLFTGDTLFEGSIGNTELLLGNYEILMKSIMEKLYPLSNEFHVFPGHGNPTSLEIEKKENPFILDELRQRRKKSNDIVTHLE